MFVKSVDTCPFVFNSVPDRYKSQETCDKAVEDFLPALNLFPIVLLQVRRLKKVHNALFIDDDYCFLINILVMSHFLLTT